MGTFEVENIEFDLAHGKIAAKWWGSKERRPILMVHGWQDNAGSFDTLIPLLPQSHSYLAIDLPGHGFSSHLPIGCYYHAIDLVLLLEEIRLKYKWKQLSLIAHSMGAIVSFFYASIFPDQVDFVCALDTLKMQHLPTKVTGAIYAWRTQRLIELVFNSMEEQPEYTYDELVRRVYEGSLRSVDMDKADYMIKRGSKPSPTNPQKFYFSRDIRVRYLQPFYVEQKISLEYIKRIRAAYLFIRSNDTIFSEPQQNIDEAVKHFKRYNEKFEMLKVSGTHHTHLNEPILIAGKIGKFIKKYYIPAEQQNIDIGLLKSRL